MSRNVSNYSNVFVFLTVLFKLWYIEMMLKIWRIWKYFLLYFYAIWLSYKIQKQFNFSIKVQLLIPRSLRILCMYACMYVRSFDGWHMIMNSVRKIVMMSYRNIDMIMMIQIGLLRMWKASIKVCNMIVAYSFE